MALSKEIQQSDGVITSYHRILHLTLTTNQQNSIAVCSYVNEDSRNNENTNPQVYKKAITYETDYIEGMTVESAYNYLKTLPEFEGAVNV